MQPSKAERQWLAQIAARIGPHLEAGKSMPEAIKAAHTDLQAFAGEMAVGESRRAKRAVRVLSAVVWRDFQHRDANRRANTLALSD